MKTALPPAIRSIKARAKTSQVRTELPQWYHLRGGSHGMKGRRAALFVWVGSILVTASIALVIWAALYLAPEDQSWEWIVYPGVILALPGAFPAAMIALYFTHQHGMDKTAWMVIPLNLVFYFVLTFLVLRRKHRKRNSLQGQTPVGNIDTDGYAARWKAK